MATKQKRERPNEYKVHRGRKVSFIDVDGLSLASSPWLYLSNMMFVALAKVAATPTDDSLLARCVWLAVGALLAVTCSISLGVAARRSHGRILALALYAAALLLALETAWSLIVVLSASI